MKNQLLSRLIAVVFVLFTANAMLFAQTPDVARRTTAITYPPGDTVDVQFRGTTRFPRMKGSASVQRTARRGTTVKLHVENMPRPFELGSGYATYVVWAVSPEGQTDNLGEIKRSGSFFIDSKIEVTTPLQTFAIIITAEPHFLVTRPSQQIMLENLAPSRARNGKPISTVAAVQYFGNSSDYFRDPRTPEIAEIDFQRTPPSILQAKQAIALARFAGADRDANLELSEAETLSQNAEAAWRAGRDSDSVDIAARRAISAAVKAEGLATERRVAREKRNEKLRTDSEIRNAEDRFTDAQNQIADLRDEMARETRNRELAERDVLNYSNQVRELRDENGRLRDDMARLRIELESAKSRLDSLEREKQAVVDQRDAEARAARLKAAEAELIAALKPLGAVVKNERGIVLTLPESYWAGTRSSTLSRAAARKLAALAEVLTNNTDYRVAVESYTDSTGDPSTLQSLTDQRSYVIADKLSTAGVAEGRLMAKGFGASVPIAPNTTAANKAKNRRVLLVFTLSPAE